MWQVIRFCFFLIGLGWIVLALIVLMEPGSYGDLFGQVVLGGTLAFYGLARFVQHRRP